jgi:hypothetical protein
MRGLRMERFSLREWAPMISSSHTRMPVIIGGRPEARSQREA